MKVCILNFAKFYLLPFFVLSILVAACKKDEATEQENITRFVLHFTGSGFDKEFTWSDSDGDGGNAPTVPTLELPAGKVLNCHIHVYDDSNGTAEDLTEEIEAEANAHLFTFLSPLSNVQIGYADQDGNGKNLGIETTWTTTTTANGIVKVTLYHEPSDKSNLASPGGEIDFTADFPLKVE